MKKRSFVLGACAVLVAPHAMACPSPVSLASSAGHSAAGATGAQVPGLGQLRDGEAWQQWVQQEFVIHGADGSRSVAVLDQCAQAAVADGVSHQFVLGFSCAQALPSGLYRLEHRNGERIDIFLNESGLASAARMRAEFNVLTT
ncbi:DUF6916 family protein [Roseateles koreensis]|uniref:DUF6916 domain-containing protein n=1 Tax=Roseateles koreensis TaxID=2987526 RepID=A0ABT5KW92_9BURK|nr:hypothetical protein [Roseateles koreensis]MDC8787077.1 hypothetical protein [Roseateles koreensis]